MHHSFVYTARVVNKSAGYGSATSSEKRWTWHKTSSRMMHYATFCLIVAGQNISGRSGGSVLKERKHDKTGKPEHPETLDLF